jgi:hypothetical protein
MDQVLHVVRMLGLAFGGALSARGIGDAALWEAIVGAVVLAANAVWSYRARQQALATVPPEARREIALLSGAAGLGERGA